MRLPIVVAGVVSVWLFYLLLRRLAGERTALIGCAMLATDSAYLLTVTFDWGPVALQHLLFIGGSLLLVRFYQERRDAVLAAGCFLFGLAMWDKALALWMLSGMGLATILTLPRQLLGLLTWRRVGLAAAGFLLGALPLLIYNARNQWGTFHGNFELDQANLVNKVEALRITANGSGLFGWMPADDWQTPRPRQPGNVIEKTSAAVSRLTGHPRRHLLLWAFLAALLLTPLAGWRAIRIVLFSLIVLVVAWLQMALNKNTGWSVHHTILLWPLPQVIVAAALGGASQRLRKFGRPAVVALAMVFALSGALVINEYYALAVRNGGAAAWSNGIFPLSDYLKDNQAKQIFCMDWGILDPLRLLHRGKLPMRMGTDQVANAEMTEQDRRIATEMVSDPEHLFLAHTKDFENFPARNTRLIEFAGRLGYRQEMLQSVEDPFGRKVFEVYRFTRAVN